MKQEEKPLVTIVTATFNLIKSGREKFFRQCLESVHNQTYKNIEHIVIDGASKDGTVNLIKKYADRGWIKYVSEPDTGIYDAMNKGIKMAKGKYIAFLNSDDFYHNPNAVRSSVDILDWEQADFSYANYIAIDKEKTLIMKGDIETFLYTMPFGHPTMLTKTSILRFENGFNLAYKVSADYDLIMRLIMKDYRGAYLDEEIMSFRLGGACCSVDYSDEIAQIYKKNFSSFYKFTDTDQAKKIMFGMIIPEDFPEKFREYALKKEIGNVNVDRVVSLLETKLKEYQERKISPNEEVTNLPTFFFRKFVKKHYYKFLNCPLRQPARKAWYRMKGKGITH